MLSGLPHAQGIRLLTCDVDGVLTDGRIYVDDDGREHKAFNALDGVGLKRLMEAGISVAWIGQTQGSELQLGAARPISIEELRRVHEGWFPSYMGG